MSNQQGFRSLSTFKKELHRLKSLFATVPRQLSWMIPLRHHRVIRGTPSMPISKDKASAKKPRRVSRSHAPGDKSNLFDTVKLAGGSVCHFGMETWSEKRVILLPHTPNLNYSPHKG